MKIVIVGGGTAGWLAALFLANRNKRLDGFQPYDITVVESSKIPIIGAGEGSTGLLLDTLNRKLKKLDGLSESEFVEKTNATVKLGLDCKDWNGDGKSFFEPLQPSHTFSENVDIDFLLASTYGESYQASPTGPMWEHNKVPFYSMTSTNGTGGYSYHFDAHKVGEYFKEVALKNGVKHIDAEVGNIDKNPNTGNIESVELKDTNETIQADLWFDCTGFSRKLINEVGGGWVDYSKWLPVNKALTYFWPYEENEEIKPHTLALAMPNGWMWQIPTQERYGCGYVYCDKFISDGEAQKELEKITGREINQNRLIEFSAGRVENVWTNNVIAVGLASNFLEPLEATSIHATIVQLDLFCNFYLDAELNKTLYPTARKKYNMIVANMIDSYKELIQHHYMTKREDSEFWRYYKNDVPKLEAVTDIIDICKYRSPNYKDFDFHFGSGGWGVTSFILTGLGHLSKRTCADTLWNNGLNMGSDESWSKLHYYYNKDMKKYWSHNEFLFQIERKKSKNAFEGLIVIDDFFENANSIRELALTDTYKRHQDVPRAGWRGFRSDITKERHGVLYDYMHDRLCKLNPQFINKKILLHFHYCLESTKAECHPSFEEIKLHKDSSNWAGVIYLTPNPQSESGTCLFSDDMSVSNHVENVYNRLVIYPSDILHGPQDLFGNDINDGRITLTIFIEN
jgi:tryptophan halogenase